MVLDFWCRQKIAPRSQWHPTKKPGLNLHLAGNFCAGPRQAARKALRRSSASFANRPVRGLKQIETKAAQGPKGHWLKNQSKYGNPNMAIDGISKYLDGQEFEPYSYWLWPVQKKLQASEPCPGVVQPSIRLGVTWELLAKTGVQFPPSRSGARTESHPGTLDHFGSLWHQKVPQISWLELCYRSHFRRAAMFYSRFVCNLSNMCTLRHHPNVSVIWKS